MKLLFAPRGAYMSADEKTVKQPRNLNSKLTHKLLDGSFNCFAEAISTQEPQAAAATAARKHAAITFAFQVALAGHDYAAL